LRFDAEDQARARDPSIEDHAAGAAVSGETAFLRAGESEDITQHFKQALARLAQKLDGFSIECSLDIYLIGHAVSFLQFSNEC
jgi:hypothetical protein